MRAHSIEFFNGKTYARTDYKTIERKHCGKLKEKKTPQNEQAQALQALQGEPSQEAHLGLLRRRFAPPRRERFRPESFPDFSRLPKRFRKIHSSRSQCERRFFVRTTPFVPATPLRFHPEFENKTLSLINGDCPASAIPRKSDLSGGASCESRAFARTAANHIFLYFSPSRLIVGTVLPQ